MKPVSKNKFGGLGLATNLDVPVTLRPAPGSKTPIPLSTETDAQSPKPETQTNKTATKAKQTEAKPKKTKAKPKENSDPVEKVRMVFRVTVDDQYRLKAKAVEERTTIQDLIEKLLIENKFIKGSG
ncbi:MAG: hypothetical protein COA43_00545 [Robiginitomaculum sp.]|nr:MAG: hypothetical protein COA43_00545 [Robiginitomaculum sp.]